LINYARLQKEKERQRSANQTSENPDDREQQKQGRIQTFNSPFSLGHFTKMVLKLARCPRSLDATLATLP